MTPNSRLSSGRIRLYFLFPTFIVADRSPFGIPWMTVLRGCDEFRPVFRG